LSAAGSQDFVGKVPELRGKNYTHLLGFNEPDNAGQSNMNVSYALDLWPQLEAAGLPLGSPGCTEGGTFSWLREFMAGARERKLRVDFLALHWYGDCTKPATLGSFLQQAHDEFKMPMWLTEFSCMRGDAALNARFLHAALPILAGAAGLQRYAWFADRWPSDGSIYQGVSLLDAAGRLTVVGDIYSAKVSAGEGA
jgi:hypothetical protein